MRTVAGQQVRAMSESAAGAEADGTWGLLEK
jgi:hypothetical protein